MYRHLDPPIRICDEELIYALRAVKEIDLQPGPGGSAMSTHSVAFPKFHPILGRFLKGEWHYCVLVGLWPSQQIPGHADAYDPAYRRHHIPLQADRCWWFSDGIWTMLGVGQIYTMDPTKLHGAVNWGPDIRWSLMIDVAR